tara:strand:+ start:56 stop:184 length:129 start_codon:yes stop_codon:yes gene_type:complete
VLLRLEGRSKIIVLFILKEVPFEGITSFLKEREDVALGGAEA